MPHGVADPQVLALLIEKQDREQIVRDDPADDLRDAREQLIQIQSFGGNRRNLQQKIEKIAAFAEPYGRFCARRHATSRLPRRSLRPNSSRSASLPPPSSPSDRPACGCRPKPSLPASVPPYGASAQ